MSIKKWRLIQVSFIHPAMNMALDEALMLLAERTPGWKPALRFYTWQKEAITIGYGQDIADINLKYCQQHDIPIIKRPTGGKLILHKGDLTHSIIIRKDEETLPSGILASYKYLNEGFRWGLNYLKIPVSWGANHTIEGKSLSPLCFTHQGKFELMYGNKKIMGSAQRRTDKIILQQGSLPVTLNLEMLRNITLSYASSAYNNSNELSIKMTSVSEINSNISYEDIMDAIIMGFKHTNNITFQEEELSKEEFDLTITLFNSKYNSKTILK